MAHFSLTLPSPHRQSAALLGSASPQPMQLRSKFFSSTSSCSVPRPKCLAQHALPQFAETFYQGLGANSQENLTKAHSGVLQWAFELGLPLPAGDATTWWAIVAPIVLSYMFATPGTAAGLVDFLYAPIHSHAFRSFSPDEVEIGRRLGEGSFGVVYEGFFARGRKGARREPLHVVLKKVKPRVKGASEIHDSEIYMNHRLQRTASLACAEFLGTMQVKSSHAKGKLSEGVWLVWNFQGDRSLDHYLKQKNFPENVSSVILSKDVKSSKTEEVFVRNVTVIRTIFKQILSNLQDLHRTGIVHRDVKPLNLILAQDAGGFKLIDFGACVDIRSGYNYVPNETVIDPTYAAPERYIMPISTPHLPPDPLCSLVSPLIWHLNTPDRFDLYSAGLILIQLSMKPLRHDTGLQSFNTELKRAGYDLNAWRSTCRYGKEEFVYLDADDRAGWELATALLQPRHDKDSFIWPSLGNSRPSASAALRHRFFKGSPVFPKFFPDHLPGPIFPGELLTSSLQGLPQYGKLSSAVYSVISTGYKNLFGQTRHQVKNKKVVTIASSSTSQGLPTSRTVKNKLNTSLHKVEGRRLVRPQQVEEVKVSSDTPAVGSIMQSSLLSTMTVTEKISNAVHSVLNMGHKKSVGGQTKDSVTSTSPAVSKVELSLETPQKDDSSKDAGIALNWIGAALPTVATSAFTLALGWLILSGLSSSASVSYDFGKFLASSTGISGSAFLAFFLVIKPWLEEEENKSTKSKGYKDHSVKEVLKKVQIEDYEDHVTNESLERVQMEKYKSVHCEQMKVGIVEAVETLETQMSSLEALMSQKQQVSQQQQDLIQKMERLLLQPSVGNLSDAPES